MCGKLSRRFLVFSLVLALVLQSAIASWPTRQKATDPVIPAEPAVAVALAEEPVVEEPVVDTAVEESLQAISTLSEMVLSNQDSEELKKSLDTLANEIGKLSTYKNEEDVKKILIYLSSIEQGLMLVNKSYESERMRADEAEAALDSAFATINALSKKNDKLGFRVFSKAFYDIQDDEWGAGIDLGLVKNGLELSFGVEKAIQSWDSFTNLNDMRLTVGIGFIL